MDQATFSGAVLQFNAQFVHQLIFQLINTSIMFVLLGKLLYNPVKKFMADRTAKIKADIENAELMLADASKLKADYELKLKSIDIERTEVLENARKLAKDSESQILNDAKSEANIIKNRAMVDIQREQEKAKDDMKSEIIEISTLIANRFVSTSIDEATQNRLFDEIIGDLGDAKWQS